MKTMFKIFLALVVMVVLQPFMQSQLQAQVAHNDVIINEFIANPTVGLEWVELLVVKSGGVDLSGFRLSDVSSKGGAGGTTEGHLGFPSVSYLQNLQQGTRIICVGSRPTPATLQFTQDIDPSDGVLILLADTLAGGTGVLTRSNIFDIATNDNIELLNGSTSSAATIDFVANGSNTSISGFPDAIWVHTGSPSLTANSVQYFRNSSGCTVNNDTAALGWQWNQSIADITPSQKNLGQNFPWEPANDGDGSATLANTSGGTFNGGTIFSPNASGRTVTVTIVGTDCGLLEKISLTVPATWGGYSSSNVTLGGVFVGKTPSYVGNVIEISGLTLGSTPGTISISNLTSPNHAGVGNSGNDTWLVKTAKSGGTLTVIGSSPVSHTIIPISNLRAGGVDGYGNSDGAGTIPVLNGYIVAVTGTITLQNHTLTDSSATSIFIQGGGYGLQLFKSVTNTNQTLRLGDSIIVKGSVTAFGGNTEVIPISVSAPNLYEVATVTVPSPLILTNASEISEANEGKLVKLNSVNWDSAGSGNTFIASASNRGMNNFNAGTGTMYLASVNNIVGTTIPSTTPITGVVYHTTGISGAGQQLWKISPRNKVDIGITDGTGMATISPAYQTSGATSVTETIVLKGDGINTIGGMSVEIPSNWTWTGNTADAVVSGPGFTLATKSVTGIGSVGDPWVITLSGTVVTNVDTGIIAISNLTAPTAFGSATFTVKTRGASGTLTSISVQPTVTITPTFPFIENFEYTTGSLLTANNWTAHSGTGTNSIAVNADPLTYTGYIHSGVGKSVTMTTNGEDVNRGLLPTNTGSVYASFMVKVTSALTTATGEYFFHLMPPTSTTTHLARVYFRKAANDNITFGTSKNTPSPAPLFTDSIYALNTTYLIVVKYTFNSGTTTDDEVKLWIDPVLTGIEPTANLTTTDGNDATALGLVALRQGAGNATPALILGGLRINTSWIPSGAGARNYIVSAGWNMISMPLTISDSLKTNLFPDAISDAFAYEGSYTTKDKLSNGIGYWLKFAAQDTISHTGFDRFSDTVYVNDGWNMIGTLSKRVLVSAIEQIPPGIVQSSYFGYTNTYNSVDTLEPGQAYWVKTVGGGKLYISALTVLARQALSRKEILNEMNSLKITDKNGISQTLYFGSVDESKYSASYYEMPPVGFDGMFDVRFGTQRYAESIPAKLENIRAIPIDINASAYPLTISWNVKSNGPNAFVLNESGENKQALDGEGKITISKVLKSLSLEVSSREVLPTQFSLSGNYPNPFNPSTKFVVAVPKTALVGIVVYDILGRQVRTLVNEQKLAGYHTIEWNGLSDDGGAAPSGVYFVRMISEKFNTTQKIMMLK